MSLNQFKTRLTASSAFSKISRLWQDISTISLKKINVNQKYKTWIFLIFVIACVALISKIWLTLIILFGCYILSIFYTIIQNRKIRN